MYHEQSESLRSENIQDVEKTLATIFKDQKKRTHIFKTKMEHVLSGKLEDKFTDINEMKALVEKIFKELMEKESTYNGIYDMCKLFMNSTENMDLLLSKLNVFQSVSKNMDNDIKMLESKLLEIENEFVVSSKAALANKIHLLASLLGLKLETKNNLEIYKCPCRQMISQTGEKRRRFELGKPCPEKDHHTILLVGMTGSGKSLLINSVVNYVYGVSYKDKFRFKLVIESEEMSEREGIENSSFAESMTSWVTSYTLFWEEGFRIPFSLTIIDTPGFGDTRGLQYDEETVIQIRKAVHDETFFFNQELTSIGLVIPSSLARLTAEQKYIFDQSLSNFGKDMFENICPIFTFADDQPPPALDVVKLNEIPFTANCMFKFNNSTVYASNDLKTAENMWNIVHFNMKTYFEAIEKVKSKSLALTKEVLDMRDQLHCLLVKLKTDLDIGYECLQHIDVKNNEISQLREVLILNKDFKERKALTKTAVQHHCGDCRGRFHLNFNDDIHALCANRCPECDSKNYQKSHSRFRDVTTLITEEYDGINETRFTTFVLTENTITEKQNSLNTAKKEYQTLKRNILECIIPKIRECSSHLEGISLRSSSLSNVDYIETLIQSEERNVNGPEKSRRLTELGDLKIMAQILRDAQQNPEVLTSRNDEDERRLNIY